MLAAPGCGFALHVVGHGSARISRALGVREEAIQRLVRGDARTVTQQLRDAISDLHDAWWDKRVPERTRAERDTRGQAAEHSRDQHGDATAGHLGGIHPRPGQDLAVRASQHGKDTPEQRRYSPDVLATTAP